ncbi:MAG: hypothetical protein WBQ07_21695 [Candidatus Acidiferrales bacterium]
MLSNSAFKQQLTSRGIPVGVAAALASTGKMRIFPTDLSYFFAGRTIATGKNEALRAACVTLIDLADSVEIQPNWRDVNTVRAAIARLEEIRANPATAEWKFNGAVAELEDSLGAVSSATEILARASTK